MVNSLSSVAALAPVAVSSAFPAQELQALVTQPYAFEAVDTVASYFELPNWTVAWFGTQMSRLDKLLGGETEECLAKHAGDILESYRAQPADLSALMILLQRDWMQEPLLRVLELTGTIDLAVGAFALFDSLGYDIKDLFGEKALIGVSDEESEKETVLATTNIGGDFRLQVRSGIYERRGGLDFSFRTQEGTLIGTMGVLFGLNSPLIVNIQGGGVAYRSYHRELAKQIDASQYNWDPFDWLIGGLSVWANEQGYQQLRGASYRLNGWIELHFDDGKFPESRRAHFEKLYDRRYLRHDLEALPDAPLLFQKDLGKRTDLEKSSTLFQPFNDLMAQVSVGK